jgi:hypothetical protein
MPILSISSHGQAVAAGSSVGVCNVGIDSFINNQQGMSFWRTRFQPITPFAMDVTRANAKEGSVSFGGNVSFPIPKVGDMAYWAYLLIEIPGIKGVATEAGESAGISFPLYKANGCEDEDNMVYALAAGDVDAVEGDATAWFASTYQACFGTAVTVALPDDAPSKAANFAYWVNALGQFIIRRATFVIGTTPIDYLYNDYLYMWEELAGRPGKRLEEMVGKRNSVDDLIIDSRMPRTLYTPLPFYWTRTAGNALPITSLHFTAASISVEFETLTNCVVRSSADTKVVKCSDNSALSSEDLRAALETTQVYLDQFERDRFSASNFDVLITQVQVQAPRVSSDDFHVDLRFNHAVIELIWAVRRSCNAASNNWFDYRGVAGMDPIESVRMDVNNTPRIPELEGQWFRLVQPYQFHTVLPNNCVYCYSFALQPEQMQPSGSLNFSRFESVTMNFKFQKGLIQTGSTSAQIIIFARSHNIIKHREGVAGPAYN